MVRWILRLFQEVHNPSDSLLLVIQRTITLEKPLNMVFPLFNLGAILSVTAFEILAFYLLSKIL